MRGDVDALPSNPCGAEEQWNGERHRRCGPRRQVVHLRQSADYRNSGSSVKAWTAVSMQAAGRKIRARTAMAHARVDTTPLQGTWSATDETTIGLVELEIRAADNAALALIACVAGCSGVVQLAETVPRAYASAATGDSAASAMTATIQADGLS